MRPGALKYWLGGAAVAFSGVLLVRLIAPHAGPHRLWLTLLGYTIAFGGLYLITVGTRRR